jgi:hypothetical protein
MEIKDKTYTISDLSYILELSQDFLNSILNNSKITLKFPEFYKLSQSEIEVLLLTVSRINPNFESPAIPRQIELDMLNSKLAQEKEIRKNNSTQNIKSYKTQKKDIHILDDNFDFSISKDFEVTDINFNLSEIVNLKEFKKDLNGNIQLTNTEALSICEGINLAEARTLVSNYERDQNNNELIARLKEIALLAIEKYGENQIKYFMGLPKATFEFNNVLKIFHELDLRLEKTSKPVLRILFGDNKNEKAAVSFYSEEIEGNKRAIFNDIIEIKDKVTSKVVFQIHRSGKIKVVSNIKNIVLKLNLFISFCNDPRKVIINYGLTTGECSDCGRELNDPISIKRAAKPPTSRPNLQHILFCPTALPPPDNFLHTQQYFFLYLTP